MNKSHIAVVEGRWFKGRNVSVRSLFDLISDLHFDSPHEYHYEMFNNGAALTEILPRIVSTNNIYNVYLAAHGSAEGVFGSNGEVVSTETLGDIIDLTNESKGRLDSIYFGSCHFGHCDNLEDLIVKGRGEHIRWLAGYTKSIDFIKSSMLGKRS